MNAASSALLEVDQLRRVFQVTGTSEEIEFMGRCCDPAFAAANQSDVS
jgi:hypothetical protein